MAFIVHLLVATLCLIHLSAGEECRNAATVIESGKDLETNVKAGGHVWQHIGGLTKKPKDAESKDTQSGKSMFLNEQAFHQALANLRNLKAGNFASCPSTGKGKEGQYRRDERLASDIGVDKVLQCLEINADKLCTKTKEIDMKGKNIVFDYQWKHGKWVIRTAWPRLFGLKTFIDMLASVAGYYGRKFRG